MSERDLGRRAPAVFEAFLDGRDGGLHPADRNEAVAFWNWLDRYLFGEYSEGATRGALTLREIGRAHV